MSNIRQVIEDLSIQAMRDLLCDRRGYVLPADISEDYLRNTILDEYYKLNLLSGRDIREMAEGAR